MSTMMKGTRSNNWHSYHQDGSSPNLDFAIRMFHEVSQSWSVRRCCSIISTNVLVEDLSGAQSGRAYMDGQKYMKPTNKLSTRTTAILPSAHHRFPRRPRANTYRLPFLPTLATTPLATESTHNVGDGKWVCTTYSSKRYVLSRVFIFMGLMDTICALELKLSPSNLDIVHTTTWPTSPSVCPAIRQPTSACDTNPSG